LRVRAILVGRPKEKSVLLGTAAIAASAINHEPAGSQERRRKKEQERSIETALEAEQPVPRLGTI
jgi:hypothetical protein